eukprot:454328_1
MFRRDYDHLFKLVLIGDTRVGKSKLLQRFADGTYSDNNVPTIGFDFRIKILNVLDKHVKLQIWDTDHTAGQQRYRAGTTNAYGAVYRGVHCIVFCFDVTDAQTFKHTKNYNHEADRMINESCHKVLVATKCDLVSQRQISRERAQTYADSLGISYCETSAKNNTGIYAMFESIVMECMIQKDHGSIMKLFEATNNKQYPFKIELNDTQQLERCHALVIKMKLMKLNGTLRDRLEGGLVLVLDVQPQMISTATRMHQLSELIRYFSNYLVFLDVVNRGNTEIFNEIIKCVHRCKGVNIRSSDESPQIILCCGYIRCTDVSVPTKIKQLILQYFGPVSIYRDARLYHHVIASCIEFECDIDDSVARIFVENANEWTQFQAHLKGNHNLQSVALNINNGILNNEISTKILYDICNCIADGVNNLTCLKLCFSGDVQYHTDAKHHRSVLHSSIAKCYASKASVIEEITFNYSNSKQNSVPFFAGNFVSRIIKNNFKHVRKIDLNLLPIQWNHINLMHVYQGIQSNNDEMQYLNISGKLFEKHFDMTKDTEIVQLLMECIASSHLHTFKFGQFSDKSMGVCIPLLSNMLLDSSLQCIELSFNDINIHQVYSLLDGWLPRVKTLDQSYHNIREYIFGLQTFDDSVKEIIMEYVQTKGYTLRIHSSAHELSNKLYLISQFVIDKLIEIEAETHTVSNSVSDILKEMESKEVQLFIDDEQIPNNIQSFNDSKIDFISKLNYMMLCGGFIREMSIQHNLYIPHEICILIHAFYPMFDVWVVCFDQLDLDELMDTSSTTEQSFLPLKWHKLSGLLDEPTLYRFDQHFYFRRTEQGRVMWYEVEFADELKDISISYSTELSELSDESYSTEGHVSMISEPRFGWEFMEGERCVCLDNGDVLFVDMDERIPASLFLLNNKSQMISIQCSCEHAMFLTSVGNVFCIGDNDKGQCGVPNKGDVTEYKTPVHLKKLSLNVIKKISIGIDYNFCIDKNNYLYCFGSNVNNKLGLKPFENEIVWEPMLHSYFGHQIHLNKVYTAKTMNIFIDKQNQCYLTKKRETQAMYHWQGENIQWKHVEIIDVMVMDEIGDESYIIMLYDTANTVTFICFQSDLETQEQTMFGTKIHGIDDNYRIETIHALPQGVMIITSPLKH